MQLRIVLDTNILVAGLRSTRGSSHQILRMLDSGAFKPVLSVPLLLEYEDVLKRSRTGITLAHSEIDDVLDFICRTASQHQVHYLWRPYLNDPSDDMVLELAVASQSRFIVTHNIRDYVGVDEFGVEAIQPRRFLELVRRRS